MKWHRYRFHADLDDPRPVIFPPPGPYWVTGEGSDYTTVVAYLPIGHGDYLLKYWPEASEVDFQARTEITFTDRFPRPEWWKEDR